jgi:hypothetical protein
MIEAAARNGWIDRDRVMMESLHQHSPRRGQHHPHVLRQGRCQAAGVIVWRGRLARGSR